MKGMGEEMWEGVMQHLTVRFYMCNYFVYTLPLAKTRMEIDLSNQLLYPVPCSRDLQ